MLFDVNDPEFKSKEGEMMTYLETVRNRKRRNQRMLVVFVADKTTDPSIEEKVTSFRRRCDIFPLSSPPLSIFAVFFSPSITASSFTNMITRLLHFLILHSN